MCVSRETFFSAPHTCAQDVSRETPRVALAAPSGAVQDDALAPPHAQRAPLAPTRLLALAGRAGYRAATRATPSGTGERRRRARPARHRLGQPNPDEGGFDPLSPRATVQRPLCRWTAPCNSPRSGSTSARPTSHARAPGEPRPYRPGASHLTRRADRPGDPTPVMAPSRSVTGRRRRRPTAGWQSIDERACPHVLPRRRAVAARSSPGDAPCRSPGNGDGEWGTENGERERAAGRTPTLPEAPAESDTSGARGPGGRRGFRGRGEAGSPATGSFIAWASDKAWPACWAGAATLSRGRCASAENGES